HGSSLEVTGWAHWNDYSSQGTSGCGDYSLCTSVDDDNNGEQISDRSDHTPGAGDYGPALIAGCNDVQVLQQHISVLYCSDPAFVADSPCLPTVSVTASDPYATKGTSDTGKFTITRTDGDWSQSLTVSYSVAGSTAVPTTDYQALSGTV